MFGAGPLDALLAEGALGRFRGAGADQAPRGRGAGALAPAEAAPLDRPRTAGWDTGAVVAQISEMARSFVGQAMADGASYASFDLRLDLRQLGLTADAHGRSLEGRALTIDLRVEASQGTVETEGGRFAFQQLDVSFSLQESWVRAEEGAAVEFDGQPGNARAAARPGRAVVDGLRELARLVDELTGDAAPDRSELGLEELFELADRRVDELKELLGRIGQAFAAMDAARTRGEAGPRDGESAPAQTAAAASWELVEVTIEALRVVRAAPAPAAAGALPGPELAEG